MYLLGYFLAKVETFFYSMENIYYDFLTKSLKIPLYFVTQVFLESDILE